MIETKWEAKKTEKAEAAAETPVAVVKSDSNHVYFYADVDHKSCLDLNKTLQDKADELLSISMKNEFGRPRIYLHVCSYGGYIFSGVSSMDTVLRLREKVDVVTIVEGAVASAGTFISIVGTERWMTRSSYMLIHQLSAGLYGKYRELKDDMKNNDELMKMIKKIYSKHARVPAKELEQILDHDLWWDADRCLEMRLVDRII